ncbi:MAG: hypothetical protein FJW26_19445, partial [Acidimicrobiia bacterium]|nr:hypothetical protein [Acidimicrobiia bacterium]
MRRVRIPGRSKVAVQAAAGALCLWVVLAEYQDAGHVESTTNRMRGRTFILTADTRDFCSGAPLGKAQEWIRGHYRRAFA